jgi:pimeloyl-ACP methyl ester carboxylesterase
MSNFIPKIVGFYLNTLSLFSLKSATNSALNLLSTPRTGKITPQQSAFLDTSKKETLAYNEHKIMTYRWAGNNQTILLIHGWESNSGRWQNLITELQSKNYNIIALDAPAHGNSGSSIFNPVIYAEFIAVVTNLYQPNILIGHSLGGMATVLSQSKYSIKSVEKLVILGAPSNYVDVTKRYHVMLGYNQRIISLLDTILTERFHAPLAYFSTANHVKNLNIHGLIIHDEADDIIPYNDALDIKNSFKNSRLITTKGQGHALNNTLINSHILKFIHS